MAAPQRTATLRAASDLATQLYLSYILEAVRICQNEGRQRSTFADSLATQRLLADPKTTPSHSAHLNLYLQSCDALAIPPFPITTNKVILRLLAILPGARARRIVQSLPPQYQLVDLRIPQTTPLGYLEAFEFIHKRTNEGFSGWPAGKEISRAEWSSFSAEIRWITECAPAFPHFSYGISLELASALPRLRALGADVEQQKHAFSIVRAWLVRQSDSSKQMAIITRHKDFLRPLDVPLFPITFEKLCLDLVRRVNLPAAVELYNTTRTQDDDLFHGFWSQKDIDEALDVLCAIGNLTRCLWPGVSLLTKHHPHLIAIRLAAPIIDEANTRRSSDPSLTVTLRRPTIASAGQTPSTTPSRLATVPARPHSSLGLHAAPQSAPPPPAAAPIPPTRPHSAHTIRTGLPSSTSAPAPASASVPPPSPAPLHSPAPPVEQDFASAYAALYQMDSPEQVEQLTLPEAEPTRSVVVLPTPVVSPPMRRVVSLPGPTTTSPHLFPPTVAPFAIRAPSTTLSGKSDSSRRQSLKEVVSAPPTPVLPSKRPSSPSANDPTSLALSAAKKQRIEAQTTMLAFCRDFAAVFGGTAEMVTEKKSLEEAVGDLKSVMEGIEWIQSSSVSC